MKRFLPLFILFAACASQTQQQSGAPVGPLKVGEYSTDNGASPVGVIPMATLHDAQRSKDLEISIEYPTRGGPFPVLVFSHGYGASDQSYEPLVAYWVSNGYVVIRPSHADAGKLNELVRDTVRDAYQAPSDQTRGRRNMPQPAPSADPATPAPFRPNPMEAVWEKEREPQWRDRVADIRLIIDNLADLENRFPELRYKVDASRIGVGGHSYGALTAMMIAGVNGAADPRVKAILAMSPQGPAANRGLTQQSWASLRVPAMFMTGSQDRGGAEGEDPNWRKQAFDLSPAGDKYFVLIEGARHTTFTGRSSATFEVTSTDSTVMTTNPNTGRQQVQQQAGPNQASRTFLNDRTLFQKVKVISLIFWDSALKGQAGARALLTQEKMPSGVTITAK